MGNGNPLVGKRIRAARDHLNLSRRSVVEATGNDFSTKTLERWESGEREIPSKALGKLSDILGVSIAYLMGESNETGIPAASAEMEVTATVIESNARAINKEETIDIPMVSRNISACCGEGSIYAAEVEWEITGTYPFPVKDLLGYTWQGGKFFSVTAMGRSMEPRICDGERIIFARDLEVENGDFALLTWDDKLLIRGMIFEQDGRIILRAVNKEYEDICVDPGDTRLCVIGKVLKAVPAPRNVGGLWS